MLNAPIGALGLPLISMRSTLLCLDPQSPGHAEAAELLGRVTGGLTNDSALTEALIVVLGTLAAGHTVRITEEHGFFTPAEAARLLAVSRHHVEMLIARGDLAVILEPVSANRLISAADVEAMRVEQHRRRKGVDAMIDALIDGGARP